MRLFSYARIRYGLYWPGDFPRINWLSFIARMSFIALLIMAYLLVDYISRSAVLSDRATVAERQKIQAENALAHCLNGGSLRTEAGGMVMCDKALWVKL